ncbi:MAG: pitrilysin family protein [Ardenticatenia bacterium]|nr:pitrilysin family protein [Ardenticatenia bacterium]
MSTPVALDISALPGPDTIAWRTLPNGLTLLARENFVSPAIFVAGFLRVGAQDEPAELAGLASLTATLLTRGTRTRSYDEINERVESVGASLRVVSATHTTTFSMKGLAEDVVPLLDVLSDILRSPTFPEEHVERVKQQHLTALREREHNTRARATLAFSEHAYPPGHPYHTPTAGHIHTVEPITRDDIMRFFEAHYEPRGGAVVIVGAISAEEALNVLEHTFGTWEPKPDRARVPVPPASPPGTTVKVAVSVPGKAQSDIVVGAPAMPITHSDYLPATVANTVLGVFGLMGRLGKNVRDREGLAYYAHSVLHRSPLNAPWYAVAGVAPEMVERAVTLIQGEIRRLGEELVPEEELTDNKSYMVGSLPLRLETNEGMASAILDLVRYDVGLDYLQRLPERIWNVDAEAVRRVTATYLRPEACVVAVAGPPQPK